MKRNTEIGLFAKPSGLKTDCWSVAPKEPGLFTLFRPQLPISSANTCLWADLNLAHKNVTNLAMSLTELQ